MTAAASRPTALEERGADAVTHEVITGKLLAVADEMGDRARAQPA